MHAGEMVDRGTDLLMTKDKQNGKTKRNHQADGKGWGSVVL